jgi:hypothetical protein
VTAFSTADSSLTVLVSSAKVIYDSNAVNFSTRFSTLDSTATAITSADTTLATVGSQVKAIITALMAVNN